MSPDDQPELDPALADAVRRAYVRPLDEATTQRHVNAIVAAAAAGPETLARPARPPRRRGWLPALVAGAAALLLPVGLAAAGITLPHALDEPYQAIGITLPHQADHAPRPATTANPVTPPGTTATPATPARPHHAHRARRAIGRPHTTGKARPTAVKPARPRPLGSIGAPAAPLTIPHAVPTKPAHGPRAVHPKPVGPKGHRVANTTPHPHPRPAPPGSHPARPAPAKDRQAPTPGPKTRAG